MSAGNLSVRADNPAPAPVIQAPERVFVPVPVPVPDPVPVIVEPEPIDQVPATQSPAATESPQVSKSDEVSTESESVIVAPQEPEVVSVNSPNPVPALEQARGVEDEISVAEQQLEPAPPTFSDRPQPVLVEELIEEAPVAQPVLGDALPEEQPGFPWWPVALLVAIGAIGVGAWRLSGR